MKKAIAILLTVITVCLAFASCGSKKTEASYKLGDTVSTDIFEFTLNAAQFTIALNNVKDDNYFTPKEFDPADDSNNPYVAPTGSTYAAFSYTVKNLDRTDATFHSGSFASVEYDGEKSSVLKEGAYYLHQNKNIMETNGSIREYPAGEWYSDPSNNLHLMTGATETRRSYIALGKNVEDLTSDVCLTVSIPNSSGKKVKFTYVVTETDRAAYDKPEIAITYEIAVATFKKEASRKYFAEHLNEYELLTDDALQVIKRTTSWDVVYVSSPGISWTGRFWFESDGRIRDDYGYVNERTWEINGDTIIIDGEYVCEMRRIADRTYLLTRDSEPFLIMK